MAGKGCCVGAIKVVEGLAAREADGAVGGPAVVDFDFVLDDSDVA